jgi:hypothetical protein
MDHAVFARHRNAKLATRHRIVVAMVRPHELIRLGQTDRNYR